MALLLIGPTGSSQRIDIETCRSDERSRHPTQAVTVGITARNEHIRACLRR